MNLLLDTHTLLWWLDDDSALSPEARACIGNTHHVVHVSAVTAWEISIKKALGKLEAPGDLDVAILASGFKELPITMAHALAVGILPKHHSDPFDRMLVAQAKLENLT
ncbi:MAG: type II toxin-antitoxin system VapC family toxin, partial [Candidatus Hydrogenedentes bacterium]|nr:type II toxin-antitoxin system VapC family toxin [Candidatus Hydrogenedentota bacterium]